MMESSSAAQKESYWSAPGMDNLSDCCFITAPLESAVVLFWLLNWDSNFCRLTRTRTGAWQKFYVFEEVVVGWWWYDDAWYWALSGVPGWMWIEKDSHHLNFEISRSLFNFISVIQEEENPEKVYLMMMMMRRVLQKWVWIVLVEI